MPIRKTKTVRAEVNELPQEAEELTPEQSESARGGFLGLRIGPRSSLQTASSDPEDITQGPGGNL